MVQGKQIIKIPADATGRENIKVVIKPSHMGLVGSPGPRAKKHEMAVDEISQVYARQQVFTDPNPGEP